MSFVNKSKFNSIVIKVTNKEESVMIQKLLFDYDFTWVTGKKVINLYSNNINFIYADFRDMGLLYSDVIIDNRHIYNNNLVFHKIYDINDLHNLKTFLKYGQLSPTYKPKIIIR